MKTKSKLFIMFLSLICVFALILSFGNIKKVIASTQDMAEKRLADLNNIPSSQSLATNSLNAIAQKTHPYILYEDSEISDLQNKVKSGYSKKAFEYIAQKVKSYKNATINVYYNSASDKSNGIVGRQLQSYVAYLGVYGMLTNDTQYINKAIELVMSAINSGNVNVYYNINGALCVADFGYAYSLAYDWFYNYLSAAQKNSLVTELKEIGNWIYNLSSNPTDADPWGSSDQNRKAWNWNAVTHGSLGVISLSLARDNDTTKWLTRAIDRIKDYYTFAVDTQGCAFEGLHYIGYALNTLTVVEDTIYNLTNVELLDYYPHFYNLTNWSMRMTAPYGNEQASIGQGSKLDNYSATFYLINKKQQRLELWGWERTYNLHNGGGFTDDYAGNGFNAPNIIFFEDQTLQPLAPTQSTPLTTTYDKGLVISRDGWQKDNSLMTFFSGWGYQGCWNHPDNNTFTFFAQGESFVIDLGANYKTSQEHNVVLVDGDGFYYTAPSMIVGNINANKHLSNGALYLKGDNSDSYRDTVLTESTRQMIYMGGQTPYVIAFDYVYAGTNSHTFTTNFFTDFASTITLQSSNKAKIVGGNTGAEALVYAFSPDSVSITTNKTDKTLALVTQNNAVTHKQATVFITKMPNGQEPVVTSNVVNGNLQVSVSYINGNTEVVDTYTFYSDKEVSVSTQKHTHSLQFVKGTQPTCTQSGSADYYLCTSCSRKFTDNTATEIIEKIELEKLGHSLTLNPAKASTCVENGHIEHYYCATCKGNFALDGVTKLNSVELGLVDHNYGEWIQEISATCTQSGVKGHYHCNVCNANFNQDKTILNSLNIFAKGHSYTKMQESSNYLVTQANCISKGVYYYSCEHCGQKGTETFLTQNYGEHNYGEWIEQVDAQIGVNGVKGHYNCNLCNTNFNENKQEITDLVIPALQPSSSSSLEPSNTTSSATSKSNSSQSFASSVNLETNSKTTSDYSNASSSNIQNISNNSNKTSKVQTPTPSKGGCGASLGGSLPLFILLLSCAVVSLKKLSSKKSKHEK